MSVRLSDLHKSYGAVRAVAGVSLELERTETLALLGPSGCGKSTLLRLVAGLEAPDAGSVWLDGVDITSASPQARGFGVVFQDFALFPHLDVGRNIGFALVELGQDKRQIERRVAELLELVGLSGLERRRVHQLSGGQQQRVALARALAHEPRLLLLDEPLSNLDEALRQSLKQEIARLLGQLGVQAVYVTHDQTEAFTVADRVAVMREGRLVQTGSPADLLERPGTAWLAHFLGYPNVWQGEKAAGLAVKVGAQAGEDGLLLRSDLVRLVPAGESTATPATVRAAHREGLAWKLDLFVPSWGEGVVWQGYARELFEAPALGTDLGLVVPAPAWVPLGSP